LRERALARRPVTRAVFLVSSTGLLRFEEADMAECEVCGNDYHMSFQVVAAGKTHTFDSFECAIHALAPVCDHCGCKIIGHGMEANDTFYCCAHCARKEGVVAVADHA
jgi:Rieske Fe-S protein